MEYHPFHHHYDVPHSIKRRILEMGGIYRRENWSLEQARLVPVVDR